MTRMHPAFQGLAQSRQMGQAQGLYSVCSAHEWVLEAAMAQALADGRPLLIEATCNQVNQFGGYTGMQAADFRDFVLNLAERVGLAREQILLGGDHLGPNPWRERPAAEAMALAEDLVRSYAAAGFIKLHLDASMPCADDPAMLDDGTVAQRAARLCLAAERQPRASDQPAPVYVIGTEVPVPGGETESCDHLQVTRTEAARHTLAVHHVAFRHAGLAEAWSRVIALVVQPGVEFDHTTVIDYVPSAATELSALLRTEPALVFEAHSTDYQRPQALAELVRDGFAILKVGPGLSFALREALWALSAIEAQLLPAPKRVNLPALMEETMLKAPAQWERYYHGNASQQAMLRAFSYSDRIRYYWVDPSVTAACKRLLAQLTQVNIPDNLLSQYMPLQYQAVRAGVLKATPHALVLHAVRMALRPYAKACMPG